MRINHVKVKFNKVFPIIKFSLHYLVVPVAKDLFYYFNNLSVEFFLFSGDTLIFCLSIF